MFRTVSNRANGRWCLYGQLLVCQYVGICFLWCWCLREIWQLHYDLNANEPSEVAAYLRGYSNCRVVSLSTSQDRFVSLHKHECNVGV